LRTWEDHGVTLPQLRVLFYLRTQPGVTTQVLASALGLRVPTVSGLIDKLVRNGLVERGSDPDDRRLIPLSLTVQGQEVVGTIRQGNQAYLQQLASDLGDDLDEMTRVLELLAERVAQRPAMVETERATPLTQLDTAGAETRVSAPGAAGIDAADATPVEPATGAATFTSGSVGAPGTARNNGIVQGAVRQAAEALS
jgi:DNA-binding MarR family transcriptional regulator